MHNYTAYHFKIEPALPGVEILIAELDRAGFDSFVEEGNELTAYILSEKNHEKILENIRLLQSDEFEISYSVEEIEPV
ncbi:MAG TPA: 50S ribosomal protein L11 methyltransferase, partial [Flavobacteriaceae bacterium]|nr:50S ribosomal protein L11 methyltransferase [Flavobacteriaceae bacterium]